MAEADMAMWTGIAVADQPMDRAVADLERLQQVGRLAGGIAHDFNNVLTVILGYLDLVEDELGAGQDGARAVAEMRRAGQRGASLTRQLLTLSKRTPTRTQPIELALLVRHMERLLRRLVPTRVQLQISTCRDAWCQGDLAQLEQVIVNLVMNAAEAIGGEGVVRVVVSRDAGSVTATVDDTGGGMDAAALSRAFDPLFTTRQNKIVGLGLPTVQSIVEDHGGSVTIRSTPGVGTSVQVRFDAVETPEEVTCG